MAPINPAILYAQVRAALLTLPGVTVFDGQVPKSVPVDSSGYILPYVTVYAGAGANLENETDYTQQISMDELDWRFQTTCVGASMLIALQVTHDVRQVLCNLPVGAGWVKPDETGFTTQSPIPDNGTNPARFFLPLPWRLITN
ncbi:hypothetical protein [Arthrobacter cryoconiti]|uniref:DUF3168 domain-containing protein n=1 Tax=Arthrobacter cryoconiti TaxID=748907 RepID=A0ABV8QXS8_9MICC|nr:hypothetical protein [Arthrobacter cryoconiti]MCC9068799.1 hypothetical protein [Arthrobacter cryoconiti]